MARKAAVLSDKQRSTLFEKLKDTPHFYRDRVIMNFSYRAGMRVGEIAQMKWEDVMDAEGEIVHDLFHVPAQIVKFGKRDRSLPMHPELRQALVEWRRTCYDSPFIVSKLYKDNKPGPITTNALTVYIHRLYAKLGFENASSHSGRRTYITKLCRRANAHECSNRDVQDLAGHAYISTTLNYVAPSDNVSKMVFAEL